tara:strand:+ start:1506 stop:2996 length:1491 start_codon:yes stop_codon:yes gene_type:complete
MKIINSFTIDNSSMPSGVLVNRSYTVVGDEGAKFGLIVQNDSGLYYNFPENTIVNRSAGVFEPAPSFSATPASLVDRQIDSTGLYSGVIKFPSISDDDYYVITVFTHEDTEFSLENYNNKNVIVFDKIYKYLDTTVTFSLLHSNAAVVEPSNYTVTGVSTQVNDSVYSTKFSLDWDVTLSSSFCTALRQPLPSDFETSLTKTTVTAGSSSTELELNSVKGLSVGMKAAATGIATGTTITKVIKGYKNSNKSSALNTVYDVPIKINDEGDSIDLSEAGTVILSAASTFVVDRNVVFTSSGSQGSEIANETVFNATNLKVKLDDVVTTTTSAVPDAVIHCTSANGIKQQAQYTVNGATSSLNTVVVDEAVTDLAVGQRLQAISSGTLVGIPEVIAVNTTTKTITLSTKQTLADGITLTFSNSIVKGIGIKNATTDPYVVSISTNDVTVNANQDIESGATVTFVGSSRSLKITGDIEVLKFGKDNITLTLNLDNFLKVG